MLKKKITVFIMYQILATEFLFEKAMHWLSLSFPALPETRLITLYQPADPNQPGSEAGEAVEIVIEDTLLVGPPAKKSKIETLAVGDLEEQG